MSQSLPDRASRFVQRYQRSAKRMYAIHISRQPAVKVYGLLRTGTNYVAKLLDLNFRVFTLRSTEEGWKHGPCNYSSKLKYVFLVKDPYSWIISFREWEKIHGRTSAQTLEEFILAPTSHPVLTEAWRQDSGGPVEAWNTSLRSWMQLSDRKNVIFLKYEDLLESFDEQMLKIKESLKLEQRSPSFQNLETRADDWKTPNPRKQLSQDYYRQNKFIGEFSDSELALMQKRLDPDVMKSFGYTLY